LPPAGTLQLWLWPGLITVAVADSIADSVTEVLGVGSATPTTVSVSVSVYDLPADVTVTVTV
jgi:hypothetical protein